MELKKRLNPKGIFIGLYILALIIYIVFGLQPVDATNYKIAAKLDIPSISLSSDVAELSLENNKINTPNEIVGSYSHANNKTLLIGHSTAIFKNLDQVDLGAIINYDDKIYKVIELETVIKPRIDMSELLSGEYMDTIVLMTCAGELVGDGDATHRLIITARVVE